MHIAKLKFRVALISLGRNERIKRLMVSVFLFSIVELPAIEIVVYLFLFGFKPSLESIRGSLANSNTIIWTAFGARSQ